MTISSVTYIISYHIQYLNYRKSLQFYRGGDYDITEEFEEIFSQNEKKAVLTQHSSGWKLILKRLTSSAFGQPFLCIGVLYLIMQWGEFDNMTIHMISIFSESKSSIDPEFAPVFVSCIMVKILNDIHIHHKNVLCSSSRDFIIITIPG